MKRIIHVCQSVDGALRNWSKSDWKHMADTNNVSIGYAKKWMELQRHLGRKVVPIGDKCEGFNYESGCPGHEVIE